MFLLNKSPDEVVQSVIKRLDNTDLSGLSNGDTTRLFIDAISKELANDQKTGLYDLIASELLKCFLSTAEGQYLDLIGWMMNCYRKEAELDNDYRYRISLNLQKLATANQIAIRLAVLDIPGIDSIVMKPFTYGTGSGTIYIINKDPNESNNLADMANTILENVIAFGNKIIVKPIYLIQVEVWVRLIFNGDTQDTDKEIIKFQVKEVIQDYLTTRDAEVPLSPEEIKTNILKISNKILDLEFIKILIDNEKALPVLQTCAFNERFVQSSNTNAIMVF